MGGILRFLIIIAIGFGIFGIFKPLPDGVDVQGMTYAVPDESVVFLADETYTTADGVYTSKQEIFDYVFSMISGAERYILLDMFLFNDFLGTARSSYRQLSRELTDVLVKKKESLPDIDIVFITDPINEIYGAYESPYLRELEEAGVVVVETNLLKLRDSNPLYSGFYRPYLRWFSPDPDASYLPNPFDARLEGLGLPAYFRLYNFKANHRKVVLADRGDRIATLVTSANPHDGSSRHSNTAVVVDHKLWRDVYESERAVAAFSGVEIPPIPSEYIEREELGGSVFVELLTEKSIRRAIVEQIKALKRDDQLDIAMFYLSDREVIVALKRADERGVDIRLLLDPNKDAFGREKNGIPNRVVADELLDNSEGNTQVRFCATKGEQCHSKLLLFQRDGEEIMIQGSANLTRRNIGNYNLETNVLVRGESVTAIAEARAFFERAWSNENGRVYSVDAETYRDDSTWKMILYRFMEDIGTSSF